MQTNSYITRNVFIDKVVRYVLFGLLAFTAVFTGMKSATGSSCSSCPGKGICRGESDCSTFLSRQP